MHDTIPSRCHVVAAELLCAVGAAVATLPGQELVPHVEPRLELGGVAFDTRRGRLVAFGTSGHLYEFEGTLPLLRLPVGAGNGPLPRRYTQMVYDEARDHVLLFGGDNGNVPLGDTWIYDGAAWRAGASTISPPRRSGAAITYDPDRERVVMYGGRDSPFSLTDTWEHDGSQWWRRSPGTVPPAGDYAMTFDGANRAVTMVGTSVPPAPDVSLWTWNGADWTRRSVAGPVPSRRIGGNFVYDARRRRGVLFASTSSIGSTIPQEAWEWDGAAWTLAAQRPEFERVGPAVWYDTMRGEIVVADGTTGYSSPRSGVGIRDWVAWDGAVVRTIRDRPVPWPRYRQGL